MMLNIGLISMLNLLVINIQYNDDNWTCGTWKTWWYGALKSNCMNIQLVLTCHDTLIKTLGLTNIHNQNYQKIYLTGGMVLQWKTFDYWLPFQNLQWFWIHCFGHCWSQYARCWRLYLSCFQPNGTSWDRCHSQGNYYHNLFSKSNFILIYFEKI